MLVWWRSWLYFGEDEDVNPEQMVADVQCTTGLLLLYDTSGRAPDEEMDRVLCDRLLSIGELQYLEIDKLPPQRYQHLFAALANNRIVVHEMETAGFTLDLFMALCQALATNHTVKRLYLDAYKPTDKHVHALQYLLRTRQAALSLRIKDAADWWKHGLDIDITTGQPALLHWTCVHQARLDIDEWPLSWSNVRGVTIQSVFFHDEGYDKGAVQIPIWKAVIQHNKIRNISVTLRDSFRLDDIVERRALLKWMEWVASAAQLNEAHGLHEVYAMRMNHSSVYWQRPHLQALRSLRTVEQVPSLPDQACVPHMQSLKLSLYSMQCMQQLSRWRSPLDTVHVVYDYDVAVLREKDMDEINDAIIQCDVRVLYADTHCNVLQWLSTLLLHPRCPIRLLVLDGDIYQNHMFCIPTLAKAIATNKSLYAIAFKKPMDTLLMYLIQQNVISSHPRLHIVPPVEPHEKGLYHKWSISHQRQYQASRQRLAAKQHVYVLARDAWQQTAFLLLWTTTLRRHPLHDACLAWLPKLRHCLGGALAIDYEPLAMDDYYDNGLLRQQLQTTWMFKTQQHSDQLFQREPFLPLAMFDSLFVRPT